MSQPQESRNIYTEEALKHLAVTQGLSLLLLNEWIRLKWDCFIGEGNCLPGEAKFIWLILLIIVVPKILPDFELQEALQHPVVRMLIKKKWKSYGHFFLRWIIFTFLTMFVSLDHLPKCTGAVHKNQINSHPSNRKKAILI